MLVQERMSKPVMFAQADMPVQDALQLMMREQIRRLPVIEKDKLVGIVSKSDILNASPSQATSLSVWELNYLLSKILVKDVMTTDVATVQEETPIEEAARIMVDRKIGGLPVMRNGGVVGIITETDLFRIFLEMFGARNMGVRITALLEDVPGAIAKVAAAIAEQNGNIIGVGTFFGDDQSTREVVLKTTGVDEEVVTEILKPLVKEIKDVRHCCI